MNMINSQVTINKNKTVLQLLSVTHKVLVRVPLHSTVTVLPMGLEIQIVRPLFIYKLLVLFIFIFILIFTL